MLHFYCGGVLVLTKYFPCDARSFLEKGCIFPDRLGGSQTPGRILHFLTYPPHLTLEGYTNRFPELTEAAADQETQGLGIFLDASPL